MTTQANVDLAGFVGAWKLNTERTSVVFRTRAAWIIRASGTLQATRGNTLVGADGHVSGEIVIDPASVDTKIQRPDTKKQNHAPNKRTKNYHQLLI